MSPSQIIEDTKTKLQNAVNRFNEEVKKLRTGRAHSSMLDGVMVEVYGTSMPLNQTANVTAPEAQLLQITPFDPSNIQKINDAIRKNESLGLNPVDDGRVIRLQIPPLTTERRQQIVKQLNEKTEECFIATRNVRHDALDKAKQAQKDKAISEDDYKRLEKQIDEEMNKTKIAVEGAAKTKEQEILTV